MAIRESDICNRLQDSEPVCDRYERALRDMRARLAAEAELDRRIYGAAKSTHLELIDRIDRALGEPEQEKPE
jgi:hypothetical protein